MAEVRTPKWCGHCQKNVVGVARGPNTLLHCILVILTCGLWLPVYIWLSIGVPFRCLDCGRKAPEPPRGVETPVAAGERQVFTWLDFLSDMVTW